jgi:hypothetical protein
MSGKLNSTEFGCWATLKEDSPFYEIFSDPKVEIVSIVPMIPRGYGHSPCYLIKASKLPEEVLLSIANVFFERWNSECSSVEEMLEYLKKDFPLKTEHFSGCWTNSPAILFGLMDDYGFEPMSKEEDEDEDEEEIWGDYYFPLYSEWQE